MKQYIEKNPKLSHIFRRWVREQDRDREQEREVACEEGNRISREEKAGNRSNLFKVLCVLMQFERNVNQAPAQPRRGLSVACF